MNTIIGIFVFLILLVPRAILTVLSWELCRTVIDGWRYERLGKEYEQLKAQHEALVGVTPEKLNGAARVLLAKLLKEREQLLEELAREARALQSYELADELGIECESMLEHRRVRRDLRFCLENHNSRMSNFLDEERKRLLREMARVEKAKERFERIVIDVE